MYVNDLEDTLFLHGADCVNIESLKLFLLMYADDIIIFAESPEGMQNNLNILEMYCKKWNLTVNTNKTKVMIEFHNNINGIINSKSLKHTAT